MSNKRHLYSASSGLIRRSKHSYTPPYVSFSLVQQITSEAHKTHCSVELFWGRVVAGNHARAT